MKKWQCIVCGWIYDEAEGYEEEDIAPGTAWEDVPEDFVCPECGVSKEDFERIRQLHLAYYHAMRQIVSESSPDEVVAVVNVQLFALDDKPEPDAVPLDKSGP